VEHQSILFVYAHPDESFLAAGTIAHFRHQANTYC
jgi:LmbE family N-acetylglucosaminyl deacetylase